MKSVVEEHGSLLLYPVQHEGMEKSGHVVYLGAAPNQQLLPALKWFYDNRGTRFFLVGSDYI
jgi:urea transport system substrate-binding protein